MSLCKKKKTLSISVIYTNKMRMDCYLKVICKSHFLYSWEHVPDFSNLENVICKWFLWIVIVLYFVLNSKKLSQLEFFFNFNFQKMRIVFAKSEFNLSFFSFEMNRTQVDWKPMKNLFNMYDSCPDFNFNSRM